MKSGLRWLGLIVCLSLVSTSASAADVLIPGKIGLVKPGKMGKFVSKAKGLYPGDAFPLPGPGGASDPALNGAKLRLFDTDLNFANGGDQTFNLPAGAAWKSLGNPPGSKGYKYKGTGTPSDPCKVVLIKSTVIKAVCKSEPFPLTTPFVDGDLGIRLVVGTGVEYCAEFGGTPVKDDSKLFKRKDAPAPAGCAVVLPTHTPTKTFTRTPTRTFTNTPTVTQTGTETPEPTETPSPTSTATPIFIGNHKCTLGGGITDSFMQLHAALPLAAFATAGAAVDLSCGTTGLNGKAPCNCSVQSFPPLLISGIFWACVNPPTGTCPAGEIDCNGGNAMGLVLEGNRNIGTCTSNADCASQCTTKCGTTGKVPFGVNGGQCEGFCTDGAQSPCTLDSQCLALAQGSCNGPDGLGFGNICDCTCIADAGGPAGAAGELSCQLAFNLTVEGNPGNGIACDGADTTINVGPACAPLTTATSSGIIMNANNGGGTFPSGGPFSGTGSPANCTALQSSTLTGVKLVGSDIFYASTIGDIDAQISAKCN